MSRQSNFPTRSKKKEVMKMTASARRTTCAVLAVATAGIMTLMGSGLSGANTSTYYFQGTGPTVKAAPQDLGGSDKQVDVSTDRNWSAEFAPVYGQRTMDQSVDDAQAKAFDEIANDLNAGNAVTLRGFSLGAIAEDRLARQLDARGVDVSNLKVDAISDGNQPGTGALVVLHPHGGLLKHMGVTTSGPSVTPKGQWTYHCLGMDGTCDLPDPQRDPVGALEGLVGYLTYHQGTDPDFNYGNRHKLKQHRVTEGNVTHVTYRTPRPIVRAVELQLGTKQHSPFLNRVLDAFETSTGRPGQQKVYEDPMTTARNIAALVGIHLPAPSAPAPVHKTEAAPAWRAPVRQPVAANEPAQYPSSTPPPVIYQAPRQVQQPVQDVWRQAAPIVRQHAPQLEKSIRDFAGQFGIRLP